MVVLWAQKADLADAASWFFFSSSSAPASNFSILTSRLRKPHATSTLWLVVHMGHFPCLPSLSLPPPSSLTLGKGTFPLQESVLIPSWNLSQLPLLFMQENKTKIRTSKWLINIPRCAINRSNYLRDAFHLLLDKPIKNLIKNNLLFHIGPFISLAHTKGKPIKESNLLHIILTFTRIEIKSWQVLV